MSPMIQNLETQLIDILSKENVEFDNFKNKINDLNDDRTNWISNALINSKISYQDIDRIKEMFVLVDKYNLKFKNNHDLKKLEKITQPYKQKEILTNSIKLNESEYKILFDDPNYRVVIPLSHKACQYFGKNTAWPEANVKNFVCSKKLSESHIIYMIDKSGKKFSYYNSKLLDEKNNNILQNESKILKLETFKIKYPTFLDYLDDYVVNEYQRYSLLNDNSDKTINKLDTVNISNNNIKNIPPLSELVKVKYLYAQNNDITDISSLSVSTNLIELNLSSNNIVDISILSNFINLKQLTLYNNKITDILALSSLTNLTELNLSNNRISDISVLYNLTKLVNAALSNNRISDISVLSNLTKLTELSLINNKLTDISVLSNLTNMEFLDLSNNKITDISALSNLKNLLGLKLTNNPLTDLSPLYNLTNLKLLILDNKIDKAQLKELRNQLKNTQIKV